MTVRSASCIRSPLRVQGVVPHGTSVSAANVTLKGIIMEYDDIPPLPERRTPLVAVSPQRQGRTRLIANWTTVWVASVMSFFAGILVATTTIAIAVQR